MPVERLRNGMFIDDDGDYVSYDDYAALRAKAEAVVEAYNDGEMPEKPLRSAIKKLREALR